jgi:protein O-GlcNAc transferase
MIDKMMKAKTHTQVSMLSSMVKMFNDLSDNGSAMPLALRYIKHYGHKASLAAPNYSDTFPRDKLSELHKEWGHKMRAHVGPVTRPVSEDKDLNRKLKIGYLSADMKRHPCAYFFEPFLRHHDRNAVHVTVYQCNPGGDEYTERLRGMADDWINVALLPEKAIAQRIMRDAIDIAVDLSGHMVVRPVNKCPLEVLAHYCAPVQASWIGYPNTTGVDCIHYRLVDAVTDPVHTQQWHSEILWRLPLSFLCFAPPDDMLRASGTHTHSLSLSFSHARAHTHTHMHTLCRRGAE